MKRIAFTLLLVVAGCSDQNTGLAKQKPSTTAREWGETIAPVDGASCNSEDDVPGELSARCVVVFKSGGVAPLHCSGFVGVQCYYRFHP